MNLRNLPTSLIYSRLFLGILIGLIALINPVSSGLILALEFLAYLISFVKFNKPIATQTYLAKLWSVFLFCFLAMLAVIHTSTLLFWVVIILGCISRLEIIFILRLLKYWKTDVSSILDVKN